VLVEYTNENETEIH